MGVTVNYFHSLPDEIKERAWSELADRLLESWFDSHIDDSGVDLDSFIEEALLDALHATDGFDYVGQALDFYKQPVKEQA